MRRLLGRAALAVALACVVVAPGTPGRADDSAGTAARQAEVDAVIAEVRAELAESSEAMVRAAADLRLADRALPGARSAAAHTRRLLSEARDRQARTAAQRGSAQVQLLISTREAEDSAALVVEQQARIGRLARAVYRGGGSLGSMAVLLEARSPSDLAERLVAVQTVVSSQRSVLADLQVEQESYGAVTADLEKVRDDLARADARAQRDLQQVEALAAEAAAAETRVSGLVAARAAALAAAAAVQARDDAAARHRTGETSQLQALLAARARADLGPAGERDGSTVSPRTGTLGWPVRGPVSSPFGMRVHPITGVLKLHTGTDLSASCGTPILAPLGGVVLQAGYNSAYGWRTVISHGVVDGALLTTTYNHQPDLGVAVGQQVVAGQVIGEVGSTGYSTGCHLHFELYVNSALVDPEPWLPAH